MKLLTDFYYPSVAALRDSWSNTKSFTIISFILLVWIVFQLLFCWILKFEGLIDDLLIYLNESLINRAVKRNPC